MPSSSSDALIRPPAGSASTAARTSADISTRCDGADRWSTAIEVTIAACLCLGSRGSSTVGICAIAALLLLVNDYQGYAGVLLAVGLAAAVNLR